MRRYTRDHEVIRSWTEARGGKPARVKGSRVLRLAFEQVPANWEAISWHDFFETLDRDGQMLLYEDTPGSRMCKLTKGSQQGPISRR